MKIYIKTKCPYCGHELQENYEATSRSSGLQVGYCDPDEGGCDEEYAYRVQLCPEITIYTLENKTQTI